MQDSIEDLLDDDYSRLSLRVSQHPKNLAYWEELLNHLLDKASPLNKAIDKRFADLIRYTYNAMLSQFPFLENYHIDYALFEYKLGNVKEMHHIFISGLQKMNNMSLLLWVEYLKICNEVISNNKQLFRKYELAETSVGLHFFSGEFWEMYLNQLLLRCKTPRRYFIVLRKVLELPIYSYSIFYAKWLKHIDDVRDLSQLTMMAPKDELAKKLKVDVNQASRRGPRLQAAKKQLKKYTKELYMVNQYQILEMYNLFEVHLKTHFYCSAQTLIDYSQISTWVRYLDYSINIRTPALTQLNFQRALLPLAHYEVIWLKYANWLLESEGDLISCRSILMQGLKMSHKKAKILDKLNSVMISLGEYKQLSSLYQGLHAAYGDKIEETDDFELFLDYLQFQTFAGTISEELTEINLPKRQSLILDIVMKRLSYGEHKIGQEELLHVICEMYSTLNRQIIEEKVFRPIIDQKWDYYLTKGKFWFEYCHRVWFDPDSSYLEKRKFIVKHIWPAASQYREHARPLLEQFCQSYLPEEFESFEDIFY